MPKSEFLDAETEINPATATPSRYFDIQSKASKEDPKKIAERTLRKIAPELKISPNLSDLKFDTLRESPLGNHVIFQQICYGRPVSNAWIRVDIGNDGKVFYIMNDLIPRTAIDTMKELLIKSTRNVHLNADAANKAVIEHFSVEPTDGRSIQIYSNELLFLPVGKHLMLVWKIIAGVNYPEQQNKNYEKWKIYVDAYNGNIIGKVSLLKDLTKRGLVFDPNPIAKLNDVTLVNTSVIPNNAYIEVELKDLSNTGFLDGPYVTTQATVARIRQDENLDFLFTREFRPFKEVMAYYHIDSVQRYLQSLGFNTVLNKPINVNVAGRTDDNSQYDVQSKSLVFGTGGVRDAEDAEVIIHEYGHAIQDNIVPGFGAGDQTSAMGEGFGDYLAASFFADKKPALLQPTFASWDATAKTNNHPPCLRRLDSPKRFPNDFKNGFKHENGEIWSACLWLIRMAIDPEIADKLAVTHHFLIRPSATFREAANAIILSDERLNQGINKETIRNIFIARGIL